MTTGPISTRIEGEIAWVTIDNPPVNATSQAVRQGLLDVAPQYQEALDLAVAVQEHFGNRLIGITGHSLGGGLATAAGLQTGVDTFVFNAAGLAEHTLDSIGQEQVQANQDNIVNFNNVGDPLSDFNGLRHQETWGGRQQGTVYWVPTEGDPNLLARHDTANQKAWLSAYAQNYVENLNS